MKKGSHCSEETKRKISASNKGKKRKPFSEEHKKKLSEANRGENNPMWGRCGDKNPMWGVSRKGKDSPNWGKHHSEETKRKIAKTKKGKHLSEEHKRKIGVAGIGKKHSEETKKRMSEVQRGHGCSEETKRKISVANKGKLVGENNPNWAKEPSEETRRNMSESAKKRFADKTKHPRWLGGISFEPYSADFDVELKEKIRIRDGRKCSLCNRGEGDGMDLHVHHIGYDKQNSSMENLILLCNSCHVKTNSQRAFWQGFLFGLMFQKLHRNLT